jgi:hypothetical protein
MAGVNDIVGASVSTFTSTDERPEEAVYGFDHFVWVAVVTALTVGSIG